MLHQALVDASAAGDEKHHSAVHRQAKAPAEQREDGPVASAGHPQGDQQKVDQQVNRGVDVPAQFGGRAFACELLQAGVGRGGGCVEGVHGVSFQV